MYCNKCGNEIVNGSEFCSKCGTKIGNGSQNRVLSKNHFILLICIIIAIIIGIVIFVSVSFSNYKKDKQEEVERKTKQEMQSIYDSTFKDPKGSLGEPVR